MQKNTLVATWSWLVITILLEVVAGYDITKLVWYARAGVEGVLALSGVVPLILVYMGLWNEHRSIKMFVVAAIFFCLDLVILWSASVVH